MKVLASLKPYYYYLIGEKIKTLEIRKSDLKNLPQDVLFYMSKDEKSFEKIPKEFEEKYRKHFGKVGMRVICDKVDEYEPQVILCAYYEVNGAYVKENLRYNSGTCLSYEDMVNYSKGKTLYGWHISDLKIYDKPLSLSELGVTRPPQSYMFVKEVEQ